MLTARSKDRSAAACAGTKRSRHRTRAFPKVLAAGGASRDRTGDLLLAKQAFSQLNYGPSIGGGSGRSCTPDLTLIRGAL
jgi:hypothetical protein